MVLLLRHLLGWVVAAFRSREDLILENLALRQQLLALHAKQPRRRLTTIHKLFWVGLRRLWVQWKKPLILVTPRTVAGWHGAGFRLYWNCLLYTSDAADEEDSVDLGGRRIINKKKKKRKKK